METEGQLSTTTDLIALVNGLCSKIANYILKLAGMRLLSRRWAFRFLSRLTSEPIKLFAREYRIRCHFWQSWSFFFFKHCYKSVELRFPFRRRCKAGIVRSSRAWKYERTRWAPCWAHEGAVKLLRVSLILLLSYRRPRVQAISGEQLIFLNIFFCFSAYVIILYYFSRTASIRRSISSIFTILRALPFQ